MPSIGHSTQRTTESWRGKGAVVQDLLLQEPVLDPGTVEDSGKGTVKGREHERRCTVRRQLARA